MRILTSTWDDGYLDYARQPGECRVRVLTWCTLGPVEGMYFVRRPDLATAVNYLREIGWRDLARKARSRRQETRRNQKFVAWGMGEVVESDAGSAYLPGTPVVFVAPSHPSCVERVVLPEALLKAVRTPGAAPGGPMTAIRLLDRPSAEGPPCVEECAAVSGWSAFSGRPVPAEAVQTLLMTAERELAPRALDGLGRRLEAALASPVTEQAPRRRSGRGTLTAVLFGYGNYAKTGILANLDPRIELVKIHEVDPLQLGPVDRHRVGVDSSPWPRAGERFDVYLIAGFHHTHAEIAQAALEQAAAAVVEKPVATEWEQVEALDRALHRGTGRLFVGFQRRYWPFNGRARADLGVRDGDPISYRCTVDEEPLPPRHWYRWPRSHGRIVANGCHWIDHFLFLNGEANVREVEAAALAGGDLMARLELDNGARFEMRLTDRATSRTGMRNTIELGARGITVRVENDADYRAETKAMVLHRERRPRLDAYRAMYATISDRLLRGAAGDTPRAITHSARVTLMLADEVESAAGAGSRR